MRHYTRHFEVKSIVDESARGWLEVVGDRQSARIISTRRPTGGDLVLLGAHTAASNAEIAVHGGIRQIVDLVDARAALVAWSCKLIDDLRFLARVLPDDGGAFSGETLGLAWDRHRAIHLRLRS